MKNPDTEARFSVVRSSDIPKQHNIIKVSGTSFSVSLICTNSSDFPAVIMTSSACAVTSALVDDALPLAPFWLCLSRFVGGK